MFPRLRVWSIYTPIRDLLGVRSKGHGSGLGLSASSATGVNPESRGVVWVFRFTAHKIGDPIVRDVTDLLYRIGGIRQSKVLPPDIGRGEFSRREGLHERLSIFVEEFHGVRIVR